LWSEDISQAAWIKTATLTTNTNNSPIGTLTADQLNDTSAAAFQGAAQNVTIPADFRTYTFSVYVLKTSVATNTFGFNLAMSGGSGVSVTPRLNTNSGNVSGPVGVVVTVADAGTYWRLSCSLTNNGTNTTATVTVQPATGTNSGSNTGADSAAATGTAVVWGAQLERGAAATTYVQTQAASSVLPAPNQDPTLHAGFAYWDQGTITTDAAEWLYVGYGFRLWSYKGPEMGIVQIFIDGVSQGTVDLYSAAAVVSAPVFTLQNVVLGEHRVKISPTDTKNAASSGFNINADAIEVMR
jgi:hypothetical protein